MANIKDALVALAEKISGESNLSAADITAAIRLIITKYPDAPKAENQEASTAADVAGVVTDLNSLLAKLKAAGLMTADASE